MIAIEIAAPGGPEVLRAVERPMPSPKSGEVLVRVRAAGVNRPDLLQRRGLYPPQPGVTDIPGLELSGTIVQCGDGAGPWREGDEVCALVAGGAYAEYCVVPAPQCLPIPAGTDSVVAAGIPETTFTVWNNVFQRGGLRPEDSLLVHGGSSGIGTTATQLAAALGSRVLVTAGSEEKCRACERLGASVAINYHDTDFVAAVKQATGGRGVDVILDIIGGAYLARNLDALAMDGRLVLIGRQSSTMGEFDVMPVLRKRLTLIGSTLRTRSVEEKGAIAAAVRQHVWPLFESGAVRVIVHQRFPLREAAAAHQVMESSAHVGKLILQVES